MFIIDKIAISKDNVAFLTHWGRVMHICVGNATIIGSDNGLSPERRQAIIWTNAGILLIGPLGTNFSEISIGFQAFSFKKMHFKMSSAKWRPFCLGLDVLSFILWNLLGSLWLSEFVLPGYLYTNSNVVKTLSIYLLWMYWKRQVVFYKSHVNSIRCNLACSLSKAGGH